MQHCKNYYYWSTHAMVIIKRLHGCFTMTHTI